MSRKRRYGKGRTANDQKDTRTSKAGNDDLNKVSNSSNSESESPDKGNGKSGSSESSIRDSGINDPDWYLKFPTLAAAAGNIPFSDPLGENVEVGSKELQFTDAQGSVMHFNLSGLKNDAIPGICSLMVKTSYGSNFDLNDPLNVAAQQFYANVRYVNSGRKNYDPADLMIAMLAICDLYGYAMWMQRLYGYVYMYSTRNTYINKALVESNLVDKDDLLYNLANFRYYINTFISRVSAFAVPSEINMFRRRAFMYAHLYTESTTANIKDQLYQFIPAGFYKFMLDSTGKGSLSYSKLNALGNPMDLNDIINFGNSLLEHIANDEDFGLISGDIIKAYGSNILKLEPCPEALIIPPEYEEYTLSQMRNATVVGNLKFGAQGVDYQVTKYPEETFKSGDIMQANDGNLVTCEMVPNILTPDAQLMSSAIPGIITVTNPTPDLSDILEATRLKCVMDVDAQSEVITTGILPLICGSDIVVGVYFSRYTRNQNDVLTLTHTSLAYNAFNYASAGTGENVEYWYGHFHWAPTLYAVHYVAGEDPIEFEVKKIDIASNVDNYASISERNIRQLHEVCLLSLLSVPGVAQLIS